MSSVNFSKLVLDGYTIHVQNDREYYHFDESDISVLYEILYYENKFIVIYEIDKFHKCIFGRLIKVNLIYSPDYKIIRRG